jgi:ABC-2 type transport system permease protein
MNDFSNKALIPLSELPTAQIQSGFLTLLHKEVKRFYKVAFQTVGAPVLTAVLYLLIFGHILENSPKIYGYGYSAFLIPGLIMMSVLQNSFANTSSSIIQSKITGNLVFVLLAPLSHVEMFCAYICAAMIRGLAVGMGVFLVTMGFASVPFEAFIWIIVFATLASALLSAMGLVAGIWADKFDQLAAAQNFVVTPLTMLSGVFYSIHSLPPFWQKVSHFNPFFYMIDGFRYGFFGQSDVSPWQSFFVLAFAFIVVTFICLKLLKSGYKLRH